MQLEPLTGAGSTGDGTFVPATGYQPANVENAGDTSAVLGTDTQTSVGVEYGTALTDINSATRVHFTLESP